VIAEPVVELVVVDGRPTVRGECDMLSAGDIEAWLLSFDELVEVDLSEVTFFDSSALRAILNVRRDKPTMRIVEPSVAVRKVLEITGTFDYLTKPGDGAG
jgi:anti-anti-sigma factor